MSRKASQLSSRSVIELGRGENGLAFVGSEAERSEQVEGGDLVLDRNRRAICDRLSNILGRLGVRTG